jgi:hypothetical protein
VRLLGRSDDRSDLVAAEFAAILDGRTLWLAVPAGHGPLVLREHGSGTEVVLAAGGDDPAYCSIRQDLTTLPESGDATYDVSCAAGPVGAPHVVEGPTRTPTTGPDVFALEAAADGALQVVRTTGEQHAEVAGIRVAEDETVLLRLTGPDGLPELDHIRFVRKRATIAEIAVVDGVAALSPEMVIDVPDGGCRVVAASGTTTWPLRRRHNDLVRPQSAVQLPTWGLDGRFELVWSASGDLRSRPTGGG